ncbi:MAG: hypothetical protein ABJN40_05855 [Sneathiella sp.]
MMDLQAPEAARYTTDNTKDIVGPTMDNGLKQLSYAMEELYSLEVDLSMLRDKLCGARPEEDSSQKNPPTFGGGLIDELNTSASRLTNKISDIRLLQSEIASHLGGSS